MPQGAELEFLTGEIINLCQTEASFQLTMAGLALTTHRTVTFKLHSTCSHHIYFLNLTFVTQHTHFTTTTTTQSQNRRFSSTHMAKRARPAAAAAVCACKQ